MELINNGFNNGKTVMFKSLPFFFEKERSGLKPNTQRAFLDSDEQDRFVSSIRALEYIRIENRVTGQFFERRIIDITAKTFPSIMTLWIISWKHEDDQL